MICIQCGLEAPDAKGDRAKKFCSLDCSRQFRKKDGIANRLKEEAEYQASLSTLHLPNNRAKYIQEVYDYYKEKAELKKVPFDLNLHFVDLQFRTECYCCGDRLELIQLGLLDRKDGYVPGNAIPMCLPCIRYRQFDSIKEYISQAIKVGLYWKAKSDK